MLATWRATSTRVLTNNKHAQRFKERKQECFKRSLGKIFIITRPYLAIEVEEVKGVHTHLDFDLWCIHILQGDINTRIHFNIFPFDKNMQIDASYSQIATTNLGTCYKELFDFSPRSCWKLTTQPSRLPLNSVTPPCCVRPLSAYYFLLLCSLHSPLLLLLLPLSPF